ncbi:pilin outer membrane usher protein SafC [Salmonella enterica subsp. diarizonae]|nr:pilin outer membrane usher protein SafC [Salmonella enterica subsp. diarizonae]
MKHSILALYISAALLPASARTYTFDASLIGDSKKNVEISLFNEGLQLPGTYNVTIKVNENTIDSDVPVVFLLVSDRKKRSLQPCLTMAQLTRYGVDVSKYPGLSEDVACTDLNLIPQTTVDFDFNRQQLSLMFPPQAMLPVLKGIAPESLWDDGIQPPATATAHSRRCSSDRSGHSTVIHRDHLCPHSATACATAQYPVQVQQ